MELSIITTLYCSEGYLEEFYRRATESASKLTDDYELIFVNDGSPDNSLETCKRLYEQDEHMVVVDLSRNFGHHQAMMTGLEQSRGERVFLIDSDLETAPEELLRFSELMHENPDVDVVHGVLERRKGGWMERWTGQLFYTLFNLVSNAPIPANLDITRLMTRRYVDSLLQHREREILIAGLWALTGYRQLPVTVEKKHKGSSSYNLRRKLHLLINGITSFSSWPLHFVFYIGVAISGVSTLFVIKVILNKLIYDQIITGYTSTIASIWLLSGIIIFSIGIVGIYLAKVFNEVKQRPLTITREVLRRR